MPSVGDVRAVADTNVLLSGLFWRGKPHALMEQVRAGGLNLISSPALLAELAEVMSHSAAMQASRSSIPPKPSTEWAGRPVEDRRVWAMVMSRPTHDRAVQR